MLTASCQPNQQGPTSTPSGTDVVPASDGRTGSSAGGAGAAGSGGATGGAGRAESGGASGSGLGGNSGEATGGTSGEDAAPAAGPDAGREAAAVRDAAPRDTSPPPPPLSPLPPAPGDVCGYPATRKVMVADVKTLKAALTAATAGDLIQLGPGSYVGKFVLTASGQSGKPIVICGPRTAILDGGGGGYTLSIQGDWTVVSGIAVTNGLKNIMLDGANDNLLRNLDVSASQQEGVHFRMGSSRNTIADSHIHGTGLRDAAFGEGVYIGSAGAGDPSDRNRVIDNRFSDNGAECIDVKEGTTGGLISGNMMDGAGEKGLNFGDSLIDMKGTRYIVENNQGSNALLNAFEVHSIGGAPDSGHDNVFRGNTLTVKNPLGVGIWFDIKAMGNVVACTNKVSGGAGLSTAACSN